jgi:hypothetical protein
MKPGERQSFLYWEKYRKNLLSDTYVERRDSVSLQKHKEYLEAHPIEWCKFFFPKFAKAEFAPFHIKFLNRILNNAEWYEVISWSRELAKSTLVMFAIMYLALTGKKRNIILASNSWDNAARLLEPYRANLDSNPRIKAYYGNQKNLGAWEQGEFTTLSGVAFRALGAGQSPRGSRNDEIRPDTLLCDDFDTDESTRNPETVKKNWEWFEQALYPTRSISEPLLTVWCGNIIAKDCCITRAGALADHWDIINIRDKNGKSSWAAKNTEEHIDRVLSKISLRSAQQEYFNNPVVEGTIFKEITWGKCPRPNTIPYIIVYGDPSTSNKDKATKTKGVSYKAVLAVGYANNTYYIYKAFVDQTSNSNFVDWYYSLNELYSGRTQVYNYIENNTLQDPFYEQVFVPLFRKRGEEKGHLPISGDDRKKPDKFARIEGNLEPLNRNGQIIFNEAEKDNPNMQRLVEQLLNINPRLSFPADGVDCLEGAVVKINEKIKSNSTSSYTVGRRPKNTKRI